MNQTTVRVALVIGGIVAIIGSVVLALSNVQDWYWLSVAGMLLATAAIGKHDV